MICDFLEYMVYWSLVLDYIKEIVIGGLLRGNFKIKNFYKIRFCNFGKLIIEMLYLNYFILG